MMEIWTLYFEELKATMRGRFAWLGAAVILLAVGGLATVGTQDTWLDGYGIIAYCLVPLGFIPFATGAIASPRANRFLESVFTAPVERSHWLAAKTLVLLTFAAAYYLALLPMLAVYTYYVGLPLLLAMFLVWAPCLLVASIAVGTLVGVLIHWPQHRAARRDRHGRPRRPPAGRVPRQADRDLQHRHEATGGDRPGADGPPEGAVPG
jgi:ABC-type Na+ efflux pump permease subunit